MAGKRIGGQLQQGPLDDEITVGFWKIGEHVDGLARDLDRRLLSHVFECYFTSLHPINFEVVSLSSRTEMSGD